MMPLSIPHAPRSREAAGHAWLLLCLVALLVAVVLWMRAHEPRAPSVVDDAQEPTALTAPETVALEALPAERAIVAAAADPAEPVPPAELSPMPEPPVATPGSMHVTGVAIRVDPSGAEHATEDGALALYTQADGRGERHDATVLAGRFELDVPRGATIHVTSLVLGGRPLRPEKRTVTVPDDGFLVLRANELRGVLLHVVSAEDGRELEGVVIHEAESPIVD